MLKIEKIALKDIKEYKHNAKLHPEWQIEQIKASIEKFGFNDPLAIDENNIIIEGHGRYLALKELGYNDVEVIRLTHMTDQEKKAYILAHNKLTMNTDFDIEILNKELDQITEIDMSQFDFNLDDILEENEEEETDRIKDNDYSLKIEAPIYEPKNEKPKIEELVDIEKYNKLIKQIEDRKISQKEKDFLKLAATRHIVFN